MSSGNHAYSYLDNYFLTSHFNLRRHIGPAITSIVRLNSFILWILLVDIGVSS
jgi:hypothetical protein